MNFKVFPATVIDDKKIPLIKGWQENASNDPNVIHQWQQQFGDRITMWGIPTGKINVGILYRFTLPVNFLV